MKKGFTLVEMLVVIVILGILMAMMVPAAGVILQRARKAQAKSDAGVATTVLLKYQAEYNRWPGFYAEAGAGAQHLTDAVWVQTMSPPPRNDADPPSAYNFKNIMFFEPGAGALAPAGHRWVGAFIDPWGQPFEYSLDIDGDGAVPNPDAGVGGNLSARAIAWSAGPDGNYASWADNAKSWE